VSPVHTNHHDVAHDDVHFGSSVGPLIVRSIVEPILVVDVEERSQDVSTDLVQVSTPDSLVLTTQEDIHSNPRIQQDIVECLWLR